MKRIRTHIKDMNIRIRKKGRLKAKLKGLALVVIPGLILAAALPAAAATGTAPAGGATLVTQPAYNGMQFYVYRPAGLSSDWYMTYDGYPVYKHWNGVWFYGTRDGANIVPTAYVVGSVVPSLIGLVPWSSGESAAPVQTAPAPEVNSDAPAPAFNAPVSAYPAHSTVAPAMPTAVYVPPSPLSGSDASGASDAGAYSAPGPSSYSSYSYPAYSYPVYPVVRGAASPSWSRDPAFLAVGKWSSSVDRIGILNKPAIPVAWKGNRPKVIYAWTGRSWYQITLKEGMRPLDALRGRLYELTVLTNKSSGYWSERDAYALPQHAAAWGYEWMGQIILAR